MASPDAVEDEDAQLKWAMAESLKAAAPSAAVARTGAASGGTRNTDDDGDDEDADMKRAIALSMMDAQSWNGWELPPADVVASVVATAIPASATATPAAIPASATATPAATRNLGARYGLAAVVSHHGSSIHHGRGRARARRGLASCARRR